MEMWLLPDSIGDALRTMQENTNSILRCIFEENPVVARENVVVYEFRFFPNSNSKPRLKSSRFTSGEDVYIEIFSVSI